MFSFKFKNLQWKSNQLRFIFIILSLMIGIYFIIIENVFHSIPIIIFLYIILSYTIKIPDNEV